ncbi:hypothetical protein CLV24_13021 [Pontibacter ummariensis]|uniref:Uncharacterized protein n=1 Tax=Pontibacter ummariensis TaxID=1610492 RepID=A0A239KQS7_9BACT|nr:hypothetical protein [Pontibacter ummariensis]PRY05341.1 hypothetical protein CLV24_13021 [Pontibacter ummariensis]SNT19544.1 hypothetical protein SAMN06296052_13021 [Pontibacter ummariensis]
MKIKEIKTDLFADYFQFYLQDELAERNLSDSWTQEAVDKLLALAPGTIGVGTARNMDVPVTIQIFDSEPELPFDLTPFEQINECDLEATSGKIVVAGCTDYFPEAQRIEVNKGTYRVRIYYGNLDKLSEDGLDGNDFYEIHMWPSNQKVDVKVIKMKNASTQHSS